MKIRRLVLFTASLVCCLLVFPGATRQATVLGQNIGDAPQYAALVKRVKTAENETTRKRLLALSMASMVTDDCSCIKDLGELNLADCFDVPALPAYSQPTREASVKSIVGHMHLVHSKDSDKRLLLVVQGRGVNTVPKCDHLLDTDS